MPWSLGLASLVTVMLALHAAPSADAKGGSRLFGLNFYFRELSDKDARKLDKSGAKHVRWIMFWPRIEARSGQFDWTTPDKLVGDLASRGIKVLPIMWGSPRWLEGRAVTPPLDSKQARDAWKGFLRAAVERYGTAGTFWTNEYAAAHPGKAPLPIKTWQIWNEPNLSSAMNPPDPGLYARLLRLSHRAIRDVDREAKLVFAGMPQTSDMGAPKFLRGVYAEGEGIKKTFDIVALHPYGRNVRTMLDQIERVRRTLRKHGDHREPLWVAEIGWGSLPKDATPYGLTKGRQGQKEALKRAFRALKEKRRDWHIRRVLWFNYRDPHGGSPQSCGFCTSAGLLAYDYEPKPAWSAFRKFTGAKKGSRR
jgi:hypothetical protein